MFNIRLHFDEKRCGRGTIFRSEWQLRAAMGWGYPGGRRRVSATQGRVSIGQWAGGREWRVALGVRPSDESVDHPSGSDWRPSCVLTTRVLRLSKYSAIHTDVRVKSTTLIP